MPVKVKCTNCEKLLSAPDAARGKAIKCPQCQTKIAVPSEEESSKPTPKSASKSKPKKPAKPLDSEAALATFDMRRAEDKDARICSKCGYDMQYQDEEDTECPKCGYDSEAGGLGAKARKKAMKGPDPADFYPGLFKQSWKFVGRNQMLAIRTIIYTMVCLTISLGCAFLYLYISMWPPRAFLALCFTISFLVIPGWMWFLDTEVIKLTLERKDKFKRLNFDFFLASAMGAAFLFWCVAIMTPVLAIPGGLGWLLVNYGGMPPIVLPICIGIGVIPALWMLPVSMSHMAMPVQFKGWMVWKVVPMWARNIKPLSVWLLFFLMTNIPSIAGVAVIAAVYGSDIQNIVTAMEGNADIARKKFAQVENPNARKKGQQAPTPVVLPDPVKVSLTPLIVPVVILYVMTIFNGFTCMFNMRTNGQFTYYNKASLEMIDKLKEYKYVAKERRGEDEDEKPKTTAQMAIEAFVFVAVFDLFGIIGGMLYGTLTSMGVGMGILFCTLAAHNLASIAIYFQCVGFAFQDGPLWGILTILFYPLSFLVFVFQNWEERKAYFFKVLAALIPGIILTMVVIFAGVTLAVMGASQGGGAPAQMEMPQDMQQGMPSHAGPGGVPSGTPPGQMPQNMNQPPVQLPAGTPGQ